MNTLVERHISLRHIFYLFIIFTLFVDFTVHDTKLCRPGRFVMIDFKLHFFGRPSISTSFGRRRYVE